MAGFGDIEERFYTCSICMSPFEDPKSLPCLHTFCEGCLRDYTESRGFSRNGSFPCPQCRNETTIPNGKHIWHQLMITTRNVVFTLILQQKMQYQLRLLSSYKKCSIDSYCSNEYSILFITLQKKYCEDLLFSVTVDSRYYELPDITIYCLLRCYFNIPAITK